jgi:hypothetical protein
MPLTIESQWADVVKAGSAETVAPNFEPNFGCSSSPKTLLQFVQASPSIFSSNFAPHFVQNMLSSPLK